MLALVAGEGALPPLLMETLRDKKTPFRLCELEGHPSEHRSNEPVIRFRIETLGTFIAELNRLGVQQICFAGRVARPPLDPSKIDPATMPLVPRMMAALQQGDDAALRTVLSFFDEAGIKSVGAHDLRPDLLPPAGILGQVSPTDQHLKDADRGREIIAAMAAVDIGQSCVVAGGQALVVETLGGTDWMMQSMLTARAKIGFDGWGFINKDTPAVREPRLPKGGVLVKAAKPGQELRIDMPVIGPDTVRRAEQVGLEGIVIEAARVMVLDMPKCIELADQHGLFLLVQE